jgi:hypothetical protein
MGLAKNIKNVDNHSASFKTMRRTSEVDAAARLQSSIAGRIKLRNTLPPLESNDLFGATGTEKIARCGQT